MRFYLRRAGDVALVVLAAVVDLVVWGGDRQLRGGGALPFWVVPVLTALVFSTLLVRWRHPSTVFWVQWTYALAGLLLPGYEPFMGLLVALHAVACRTRPLVARSAVIACIVPFGIDSYNAATELKGGVPAGFATSALLWAVLSGTVWGLGRISYAAHRRAERARELLAAEGVAAIRAERLRLARELHDVVAHAVSVMILQAAGARTLVHPRDERVRQSLEVIEAAGVQAMAELHRLLGLLRSVDPGPADAVYEHQPTLKDLPSLIEFSRASGLVVDLAAEGEAAELDPSVDLAAYRVIQEALTNTCQARRPGRCRANSSALALRRPHRHGSRQCWPSASRPGQSTVPVIRAWPDRAGRARQPCRRSPRSRCRHGRLPRASRTTTQRAPTARPRRTAPTPGAINDHLRRRRR